MNPAPGASPAERLALALAGAAVPEQFRRAFTSTPPDPAVGQMWRARRDDTSMLVLLARVKPTIVDAIPVTLDPWYQSEDSVVLARNATQIGVPLTVWPNLARAIPMRILENYAGDLELDGADVDPVSAARAAGTPGRRLMSPADPVWEYRARTSDAATFLASASLPTGTGQLPAILAATALAPADLARILDVSLSAVLQLRRGQAAISSIEAARLAPVLNLPSEDLVAANPAPPTTLIAQAGRPQRRAQVSALAQAKRISEDAAYTRVVFGAYALAARAAGETDTPQAWDARLDRYFEMVLDG